MNYTVVVNWPPAGATVIHDGERRIVAEMYPGTSPELAHQFAAAPELLEAAEAALAQLKEGCNWSCKALTSSEEPGWGKACKEGECSAGILVCKLEAAIAKAKGGEAGE